jgi:GntR family transcriptional regulator/MocR family aminotransferase
MPRSAFRKSALEASRNAAGLHMTIRINGLADFYSAISRSLEEGIYLRRLHTFNQGIMPFRDGFLLGFGAIEFEAIRPAAETFACVVNHLAK